MTISKLKIIGVAGLTAGLLYGHEESVATRLKTSSQATAIATVTRENETFLASWNVE